ncbi:MAG: hypothetical protein J6X02_05705, partial [Bacilli bacterium]|nr:hypothetical protein [Bacilli bacterium]
MYIFRRSCFKDKNEVKSFLDTKDDSEKEGVINAINLSVLSDVLNRGGLTTEAKKAEKYKELFENSVGRQTFRIGLFKHKVNSPAYVNAQRNKFKTLSGKKDNSPSVSLNCFMRDLFDATLGESSYSIFDVPAGFILLK